MPANEIYSSVNKPARFGQSSSINALEFTFRFNLDEKFQRNFNEKNSTQLPSAQKNN